MAPSGIGVLRQPTLEAACDAAVRSGRLTSYGFSPLCRGVGSRGLLAIASQGTRPKRAGYGVACRLHRTCQSMGRRGVCYDGAESFFATINENSSTATTGMTQQFFRFICSIGSILGTIEGVRIRASECGYHIRHTQTRSTGQLPDTNKPRLRIRGELQPLKHPRSRSHPPPPARTSTDHATALRQHSTPTAA